MNVTTAGDLGDLIMLLGILSELEGGPHTLILRDNGRTHGIEKHYNALHKLVTSQPYIKAFEVYKGQPIDWASEEFRNMGRDLGGTLLDSHWRHGSQVLQSSQEITGAEKWLHVTPNLAFNGRVIFARSSRYRNDYFPWREVVRTFGSRAVFVGLEAEHSEFCADFGFVPRQEFTVFYDLAAAIAGSELFVGNQSFPNALNEGLKHDSIQETCALIPDCVFKRPNAHYVFDGALKHKDLVTPSNIVDAGMINTEVTPPGGWVYPLHDTFLKGHTLGQLRAMLRNNGSTVTQDDILRYTAQRLHPEYYRAASRKWWPRIEAAFKKAGVALDVQ